MENDSYRIHVTLTDVDGAEISRFVNTVQPQLWKKMKRRKCFRAIFIQADVSTLPGMLHLTYDPQLSGSGISDKAFFSDVDSCISAPLPFWKQPTNDQHLREQKVQIKYYQQKLFWIHETTYWLNLLNLYFCLRHNVARTLLLICLKELCIYDHLM